MAVAALAGCVPTHPVTATLVDGRLVFESDDDADFPPWCLSLRIRGDDGVTVWEFKRPYPEGQNVKCGPKFPLAYGALPSGAILVVAPKPIVPGRIYSLRGDGAGELRGYFRLGADRLSVKNLDPKEVDVETLDSDVIGSAEALPEPASDEGNAEI